jgi:hypothetical protein
VPFTVVQIGVVFVPPGKSVSPWQYTPLQLVPLKLGAAASARARAPHVSSAGSGVSMCPTAVAVAGTT